MGGQATSAPQGALLGTPLQQVGSSAHSRRPEGRRGDVEMLTRRHSLLGGQDQVKAGFPHHLTQLGQ